LVDRVLWEHEVARSSRVIPTMAFNCSGCECVVPEKTVKGCWEDIYTPDHFGMCCDCFDAKVFGMTKEEIQEADRKNKEKRAKKTEV
jgi:hypothetical protein